MKYKNTKEMKLAAEGLVNKFVKHYKSDWDIDNELFCKLAEEHKETAVFIVRECGTYLLPCSKLDKKNGSVATSILSYYVEETLDGSDKNRFYIIDFRSCSIKYTSAEKVSEKYCA